MRILFLDDEKYRHQHIQKRTKNTDATVTYVWTGNDAIKNLECFAYDLIMLDHDLGYIKGQKEVSGLHVAKKLALMNKHKETTIVIHSLNPLGASNMKSVLKSAGFKDVYEIPHAWQKLQNSRGKWIINADAPIQKERHELRWEAMYEDENY